MTPQEKKVSGAMEDCVKYKTPRLHVLLWPLPHLIYLITCFTFGNLCTTIAVTSHGNLSRETEQVAVSPFYD